MNECRIYFGKKFYKQTSGYWANREWTGNGYYAWLAHRWVWMQHHGELPQGLDIHHIDGDKSNNEIENLKALTRSEHLKEHCKDPEELQKRRERLSKVRPNEWLKSEEGRKAVSEKGKEVWAARMEHPVICQHCGQEKMYRRWARFCSKKCYMSWRWINVLKPRKQACLA